MVAEFVLGIAGGVVGGGLAVAGGFTAQRYQHVLKVREAHHADLAQHVLDPWVAEVERQRGMLHPNAMGQYVAANMDERVGFTARGGMGLTAPFPPETPLWDQAKRHWPRAVAAWERIAADLGRLDDMVIELIRALEKTLPDPPRPDWHFQNHDPGRPGYGRRAVAQRNWVKYWSTRGFELEFRELLGRDSFWDHAGSDADRERCVDAVVGFFQGRHGDVDRLLDLADRASGDLGGLRRDLLRFSYDRNLGGRCDYCPRFLGRPPR